MKSLKIKDIESLICVEDLTEELDSWNPNGQQLDIHYERCYKSINLSKKCTLRDFLKKAIEKHGIKAPINSGDLKLEDWARLRVYKSSKGRQTLTRIFNSMIYFYF